MASIPIVKQCVRICRSARVTPFIWGHRGLGKSSLVRQLCAENHWGFIDLRCSQLEASDVRGLPETGANLGLEENRDRTYYLPPADMPIGTHTHHKVLQKLAEIIDLDDGGTTDELVARITEKLPSLDMEESRLYQQELQKMQPLYENGILFVDEVNRAQDDVLQAIFQLVLDHRVGQYVLPPGWNVVAAGNFMEGYQVSGFNDPAFLDRFCHLTLSGGESTVEDWVNYMSNAHGADAMEVIEFASQNVKHLDGDVKGELGFGIQPSRRSWEACVNIRTGAATLTDVSDQAIEEVIAGLIGRELARSYTRYSCPVKPRQLINDGVKSHASKMTKLNRNQQTGLMWGLVSYCKEKINEDKISEVCLDFAEWMVQNSKDKDLVVAFCRALIPQTEDGQHKAQAAVISNPRLAKMMANLHKKTPKKKKTFIDRLTERPKLQNSLSHVAWGGDGS